DPERLARVPSGIEMIPPDAIEDGPGSVPDLRASIGVSPEATVVGTLASLTAEKNHALLLEAAVRVVARVPDSHFVWIGEGGPRGRLEGLRRSLWLDGRVHMIGFRHDAPALLRQFTLFTLPSIHEGLGTAVLEAQLAGIPVVATAVGGIPEIVEDGRTGRLV